MKKIILPLFLFFLLVLGIVVVFIYQQRTSARKTYIDPTLGYSLQYPASWKVETIEKPGNVRISNPDKYDKTTQFSFEAFEIDPYNHWNIKTPIPQWTEEEQKTFAEKCGPGSMGCGGGSPFNLIKETTINNKLAYKVSWSNVLGTQIIYLIPYNQMVYSLILYKKDNTSDNFDEGTDELAKIYQIMLNSFKLLN